MVEISQNNRYFQYNQQYQNFYQPYQSSFNYSNSVWQMPTSFSYRNPNPFGCCNHNYGFNNTSFLVDAINNFNQMIKSMFFRPPVRQAQAPVVQNHVQTAQLAQVVSTADVNKIKSIPDTRTETPAGVNVPSDLKQNIEKAQSYLLQQLPNLSDEDLKKMNISPEKRDRIMEYLKNITYDTDHDTMQGMGSGIVVSTNCKGSENLANMITMLMHEANHCDEKYLSKYPEDSEAADLRHRDSDGNPIKPTKDFVNTKEEERACETLGLLTTAVLIKNGTLKGYDNYGRYGNDSNGVDGHNRVTDYLTNKELLKADVNGWVSAYTNYPEGLNNAGLTVEHLRGGDDKVKVNLPSEIMAQKLELKAGDKVTINGTEYSLGNGENGIVLSPMDSIPVFQVIPKGDTGLQGLGRIVFDDVPITEEEKTFFNHQHNNQDCFGFLNNGYQEIVFTRNDGTTIKGKFYP